jgi:AbrB family looped-hinge helix DNA binding protein
VKVKLSSKGQLVLPLAVRNKYLLKEGDTLTLSLKEDSITLVPEKKKRSEWKMIKNPDTGMVSFTLGPDAPAITHAEIRKLLEDFP